MSYDKEDSNQNQPVSSLRSEIIPLYRLSEMNTGDGGDDGPSDQQKRGMGDRDLYPGFARLISHHPITRSSTSLAGNPSEKDGNKEGSNKHPLSSDDDEESSPIRKRRRADSTDSSHTKDHHKHQHEKSYVHHEYHDYSGLSGGPVVLPPLPKKGRGGVSSMFPTVLHHMLDDAVKEGFADVVSWLDHGRAFHVHKPETFVKDVMTKYFRHTRLSSFQRQLSLYGFKRLARKGPDRGAYYHECFLRGMMHLCSNMQRTRVKGTMVRQSSSPESEPDFALLPPVGVNRDLTNSYSNSMMIKNLGEQMEQGEISTKPRSSDKQEILQEPSGEWSFPSSFAAGTDQPPINNSTALSFDLPRLGMDSGKAVRQLTPTKQPESDSGDAVLESGRPRGTKFFRLLAQTKPSAKESDGARESGALTKGASAGRPKQANSPDGGDGSQSSGETTTQSSGDSKTRKVDAELAVFLKEVDLESEEDEALESEEAMARILEQDITQISEV